MTRVSTVEGPDVRARSAQAKTHALGRLAMWVGLAAAGCTAPGIGYGNCVAACTGDGQCVSGMECKSGFCVERGWDGSCGPGDAGSGGNSAIASSTGGTGTAVATTNLSGNGGSTTTSETSGSSMTGGTGSTSSAGGVTSWGASNTGGARTTVSISVTLGGMTPAGGAAVTGGFTASGGSMDSGGGRPSGGALASGGAVGGSADAGAGGTSTGGQATGAGGSGGINTGGQASVTGGSGVTSTTCSLSILTSSLKDGCQGEVYSVQLQAAGVSDPEWSATLPVDAGLSLSKDGKLSGVLNKPGEYYFDVSVKSVSGDCTATQRLAITINGEATTACPTIKVKNKTSSALAPASCVAWPYAADFEVSGGTGPSTWLATKAPTGVTFDSTSQHASGTATDSGDLVLRVTDGTGRIVQRSFAVPLREKCWFGYISSESGAQRLHLFDPLLGTRLQRPESNSTDISVTDYKFSPDGKFIAYRVKDGSGNSTLTLWQSPGWDHEQELNLGGSVTEYSWSNNGQVLAAAIDTGTETLLGGISVAGVPDDQPIAGSIQGLYELQPVVAQVSSELTWYGADRYLAFSWYMADYDFDQLSQTNLEQSGFSAVESPSGAWYDPSLILYSSEVGFFAMVPATGELDFIAAGTSVPVLHTNVAIAPRGAYVASASNNVLSVYSASSTTKPPAASPIVTTPNCDAILGWAESQARIPCVDTATGTVKSHSIALQEQTVRSATVDGSQTYVSGSWKGYRRQVSRSGDRMILTTGTDAFMADLGSPTPALTWSLSLGTTPEPTEVSFSPNEELIAIQHGTVVQVVTTASTGSSSSLGKTGASAQACQDAQMSARDWCGTSAAPTQATWSRDSNVLAFVRDSQQLVAYDLRPFPNGVIEPIQVLVKCGGECIGTGVFQP